MHTFHGLDYLSVLIEMEPGYCPALNINFKGVLEGYCRCPDSHDLSECHHLYDL